MAIHFYDESPSGQDEQLARLGPPTAVSDAGIPCMVYGEDALSIIHFVPTVLFDMHLIVADNAIDDAISAITSSLPYFHSKTDPAKRWNDHPLRNKNSPYAFNLNDSTKLLIHRDQQLAADQVNNTSISNHLVY